MRRRMLPWYLGLVLVAVVLMAEAVFFTFQLAAYICGEESQLSAGVLSMMILYFPYVLWRYHAHKREAEKEKMEREYYYYTYN